MPGIWRKVAPSPTARSAASTSTTTVPETTTAVESLVGDLLELIDNGNALRDAGRWEEALVAYDEAVSRCGDNAHPVIEDLMAGAILALAAVFAITVTVAQ